jgi:hypothetical protein
MTDARPSNELQGRARLRRALAFHERFQCSARSWSAAVLSAPYTDRLRPVSRSDWMTVAVGFSPRLPEARIRVAERRLSGRICQPFKRRSATPTRWVLHRGLKPTATLGRRSATKPNQLSTIRVRSRASEARRRFRTAYAARSTLKRRRRCALPAHSKGLCNEPGSWPRGAA